MTPLFAGVLSRDDAEDLAAGLQALARPVRLQMISLLGAHPDGLTGVRLQDMLSYPLEQPTISHHLRLLARAGLVDERRDGTYVIYTLNPKAVGALADQIRPKAAR